MNGNKVKQFMQLAGQSVPSAYTSRDPALRKLGAQLLLSEVLEYVIKGLGITPEIGGVTITDPEAVTYHEGSKAADEEQIIDGLADTAYTMYWNMHAFGVPLEGAFDAVCENNLEKFVRLTNWTGGERALERAEWNCSCGVRWPEEVARVEAIKVDGNFFAVGKDARGKVRKPSSYKSVDLTPFLSR